MNTAGISDPYKPTTVTHHFMDTGLIWTTHYYGQFIMFCPWKKKALTYLKFSTHLRQTPCQNEHFLLSPQCLY